MSIRASNWAWETGRALGLNQGELLVLVRIADHADNDGKCWPGEEGLAEYVCASERTVRRHLGTLSELGLLHRERRTPKQGRGRLYDAICLHLDQPANLSGSSEPTNRTGGAARSAPTNRTDPVASTGQTQRPYIDEPPGTVNGSDDQRSSDPRVRAFLAEVSSLFPSLNRVVGRKGARPLDERAVYRACEKYADRDFERELERFEHYWLAGEGENRKLRDVVRAWANWLETAPSRRGRARPVESAPSTDRGRRVIIERQRQIADLQRALQTGTAEPGAEDELERLILAGTKTTKAAA